MPVPVLTPAQQRSIDQVRSAQTGVGRLARVFAEAGFDLYLVGGPLRNALRYEPVVDWDFTTPARPDDIERMLRRVAVAVWDVGREFGTIAGQLRDGEDAIRVEITTFRSDVYAGDSRKPEVSFGDDLIGDLVRRDFTVNAMALSMTTGELFDPFGGLADLEEQVLRTPSTPELSFSDDPLRMMRAARFASQLGFVPAADVLKAMGEMNQRLDIISAERIRDEFSKLLLSNDPRPGLTILVMTGLAERFLPELVALRNEQDEHRRHKDIYEHTLTVMEQSIQLEKARGHAPDLTGRLAALLHDIGKPRTRRFEPGGKVSFYHHDIVGAKMARKRLTELRYPTSVVKDVSLLIELHLRFHGYADTDWTDAAVRRYVRDAGDQLERLHILTRADCTTRNLRKAHKLHTSYEQLEWRIDQLAEQEELDAMRPDLDGNQIMEILGVRPGPVVGQAYRFLMDQRMEFGPLGEARAREILQQWWDGRGHQ